MRIHEFEWDEENVEHIARHGVNPEEVEEACYNKPIVLKGRQGAYLVHGQTDAGRYLLIVARYQGRGWARVITARDMSYSEKRFYRQRR